MKNSLRLPVLVVAILSLSTIGQVFANGSPDFSVTTNCDYVLPTGCGSSAIITATSINGFSGTVTYTTTSSPSTGITPHLNPTSVSVPAGGNANSTLTLVI